jgi:hypothetical protein
LRAWTLRFALLQRRNEAEGKDFSNSWAMIHATFERKDLPSMERTNEVIPESAQQRNREHRGAGDRLLADHRRSGASGEDGKRTRHRETVKGNKRDAERRLREILSAAETGVYVAPSAEDNRKVLGGVGRHVCGPEPSPRTAQSLRSRVPGAM